MTPIETGATFEDVIRREAIHIHNREEPCTERCGAFEVERPVDAEVYRDETVETPLRYRATAAYMEYLRIQNGFHVRKEGW